MDEHSGKLWHAAQRSLRRKQGFGVRQRVIAVARKRRAALDHAVGYGRPPKATQFKKGQSGNPRGRPKGTRPVGAVLQEILGQKVAVSENGKTRRLPALEVMLRRLANDAMRSEPVALKLMLSLFDRYGESPEAGIRFDEILAEDKAILAKFLKKPSQRPSPSTKSKKGSVRNVP
jgi:hypothetical protein